MHLAKKEQKRLHLMLSQQHLWRNVEYQVKRIESLFNLLNNTSKNQGHGDTITMEVNGGHSWGI